MGAIILGDLAVSIGLFTGEAILYTAITAICGFATPSIELSNALRLFRYVLFLGAVVGGWWGLGAGLLVTLLTMGLTKSFGIPYLWPLVPLTVRLCSGCCSAIPSPGGGTAPPYPAPRSAGPEKDRPRR